MKSGLLKKLIAMALPFLIKKGVDYAAKRGKPATSAGEKQLSTSGRAATKRARQAARVTRKMR